MTKLITKSRLPVSQASGLWGLGKACLCQLIARKAVPFLRLFFDIEHKQCRLVIELTWMGCQLAHLDIDAVLLMLPQLPPSPSRSTHRDSLEILQLVRVYIYTYIYTQSIGSPLRWWGILGDLWESGLSGAAAVLLGKSTFGDFVVVDAVVRIAAAIATQELTKDVSSFPEN